MLKKISLLFFTFSTVLCFSEEFIFSRNNLNDILAGSYFHETSVTADQTEYSGISFLEAFPLMEEVYYMEIRQSEGSTEFRNDNLADLWGNSYIISDRGSIHILFNRKLLKNITEIRFKGYRIESSELEIWLSWEGIRELKSEISRFADYHNLKINAVEVPKPDSKLISVVRAGGQVPDIVMLQSSAVESLANTGAVQRLDYLETDGFIKQGIQAFTLEGSLWAVPFYYDTQIIFYNKKLIPFPPAFPWTLTDLEKTVEALKTTADYPMAWNAYSSNWLIPFQIAFGKEQLLNKDGSITVNDIPTEKSLEYIISLINRNLLYPMERDAMDSLFIGGKIGIIISGSYSIPYFESLELDFGILPFPANEQTGKQLSPLLDFKAFSITRRTKSPVLSRRLIQYMTGAGVQQRFCAGLTKLPVLENLVTGNYKDPSYPEILKAAAETGTVIPPDNIYRLYKNNMWKLLRFALSGKLSVTETLNRGQILMNNTDSF